MLPDFVDSGWTSSESGSDPSENTRIWIRQKTESVSVLQNKSGSFPSGTPDLSTFLKPGPDQGFFHKPDLDPDLTKIHTFLLLKITITEIRIVVDFKYIR